MKTWEMLKELTENPTKKFKSLTSGEVWKLEGTYMRNFSCSGVSADRLHIDDEWEEIPQEVPFLEAVKSFCEGKTVRCEWYRFSNSHEIVSEIYKPDCNKATIFKSNKGEAVCAKEILEGEWFIE
jgi:hypothetical protein